LPGPRSRSWRTEPRRKPPSNRPACCAFFNFAQGTGARDPTTGQPSPDEREGDLTVDYRVTEKGWLEGLWLRLRGAILQSNGSTQTEIRLILNYAFPVL
jgi:hypothetical protein